jgi:predicted enzyme related to lactoylglutathione lyase
VEPRIKQFILVVTNQADALEFYTNKVGFEKKTDFTPPGSYRWVTVGPKGQPIELALWQLGSPDPDGHAKNWRPGNAPPITMWVEDCRRSFDEMRSRGIQFHQVEPYNAPWGTVASFNDPDGNTFAINQYRDPTKA